MAQTDKHGKFTEELFTYRMNKDNKVFISYQGKQITILKGMGAQKFLARIEGQDDRTAQIEMARVTGNLKRGNER